MLNVDVDLRLFEEITADIPPCCESVFHGTDHPKARYHDGPAAWMQLGPCHHTSGYRCDQVVQYLMKRRNRNGDIHWSCDLCNINNQAGRFIPLNEYR